MPIRPFTVYPQSTDPPEDFASNGDSWIKEVSTQFIPDANTLEENVNAKEISATEQAAIAANKAAISTTQAGLAADQATIASSYANYIGLWSGLTGSLNTPASTYHAEEFWALLSNVADVTIKEPGVAPEWVLARPVMKTISKTLDYQMINSDLDGFKTFDNSGAVVTVIYSLPVATPDKIGNFVVKEGQYLEVVSDATNNFRWISQTGVLGGKVSSNIPGTAFTFKSSGTEWVITSLVGFLDE